VKITTYFNSLTHSRAKIPTDMYGQGRLEKLVVAQLVEKLSYFYETWRFIIVLTGARHPSLFQARSIQSTPYLFNIHINIIVSDRLIREWFSWSGRNLTWNFARLQSPSSNDCTQNFSCFYAAQGCEKIAQSRNVQFKFAQPRTRMTAVCLAVTLHFPVHSNWLLGPGPGKAVKKVFE
jgi:hypothetical protein